MNFEHLLRKNIDKIKNKKILLKVFNYLQIKITVREKLKLGALTFDIKEIKIGEFILTEIIDIRFIRQDNTFEDSLKIDNRLNALN